MIFIKFCTSIIIMFCIKQTNAQVLSDLPSGLIPDGSPHGPPGSITEETNPATSTRAPSEEDVIGSLLKNPGLPPALSNNESAKANSQSSSKNEDMKKDTEIVDSLEGAKKDENDNLKIKSLEEQKKENDEGNESKAEPEPPLPDSSTTISGLQGSNEDKSENFPPASPPSYIQCLHRIQSKVCDPDSILVQSQRSEIDEMLKELEDATRKDNAPNECDRSGLEVMIIIVKHSNLLDNTLDSVQKKLSDSLNIWVQDPDHHCEKPLILMMSADPEISNRKVWTGRHYSVPVDGVELIKLFMDQEKLLAKEKYSEVILNVIDGVLSRYERALNG